jgi:hypothetical protein
MLPMPFSRCVVLVGPPVVRREGESDESYLRRLDAGIDLATEEADRICGVTGAPRGRAAAAPGEDDDD